MSFLNPQGFYGLLLALPIIALYLMRLHYVDTVVPSLSLWQSTLQDRYANRPWQKLKRHWLLLLQLIVLLCVVLSLAQPVLPAPIPVPERVLVLLDISASMSAQTEQGGTRFEKGVKQLQQTLSTLGSRENLTLIAVGMAPKVLIHNVDSNRFIAELTKLESAQGAADWESAARLARGLVGVEVDEVTTIVVSDFAFGDAKTPTDASYPGELTIINVGDQSANVGLVNFAIRNTDEGIIAFVRVQNAGPQTTRTLDILADGVLLSRQTLSIPPDGEVAVSSENITAEAWVEAMLLETDAFPLDDHAWAVVEGNRNRSTLLVSSGNRFLAQALGKLPAVDFHQTNNMVDADSLVITDYASLVVDISPLPLLPQANMWIIAPDDDSVCGTPEQVFTQPALVNGQWQHSVLEYVDWSDVHVSRARRYQIPANSEVLLHSLDIPLLWAVESGGYKALCTAFRLQDSDLPLRLAFPVLTSNIINWLSSHESEEPQMALRPGQTWVPLLTANTTAAFLSDPQNNRRSVPIDGTGLVLHNIGLYRYWATTPAGQEAHYVAVSLLDSQESDLRARNVYFTTSKTASTQLTMGQREINRWTLALAVMLCLLEAVLWWGRGYRFKTGSIYPQLLKSGNLFALLLRFVMLLCLLGAFIGVRFQRRTRDLSIVFVVDHSDSTQQSWDEQDSFIGHALAAKKTKDQVAVIVFGQDAWVDRSFSSSNTLSPYDSIPGRSATDIEQAIQLAMAIIPQNSPGRIVLLSDGLQTTGQGLKALRDAVTQGIDVLLLKAGAGVPLFEVWLEKIQVPTITYPGDQVPINVHLATNSPQTVRINWSVGTQAGYAYVDLGESHSTFQFTHAVSSPGFVPVRVCVEPLEDQYIENNCADSWIVVQGTPKVLVVGEPSERSALAAALQSSGLHVDEVKPIGLPQALENLVEYSAVILVNTPLRDLPVQGVSNIVSYVRDMGGGLIAVGGPESYGVGGWFGTPLEQVLPVEMRVQDPQRFPPMIMALVIDTSGSMANAESGVPKITLAAEAALRVTESLNVGDILFVIGYSDGPDVTFGPIEVDLHKDMQQEFYTLRAGGGGIYVYESLEYALQLVNGASLDNTNQRHLIILADGSDAEHQQGALNLIKESADLGLSMSVVSIGSGDDVAFLSALADAGQGRFYLADRASDLPSIFTEEVARAKRSYIVEGPFYPEIASEWGPVADIKSFPPLLGYVAVSPKSASEIVWYANEHDPLLAVWQFGLGRSVAWTSDATSRWSAHWVTWDEFAQFWGSLTRAVLMPVMDRDVEVRVNYGDQDAHVVVDLIGDAGVNLVGLDMRLRFSGLDPDVNDKTAILEQGAPGRYEGVVTGIDQQAYLVRLYGDRNFVFGWTPPPTQEYLPGDADTALLNLANQSGAHLITNPDDVVERNLISLNKGQPLTSALIAFSAFLWVSNIAWRRLALTWKMVLVSFSRIFSILKISFTRSEKGVTLSGTTSYISRLTTRARSKNRQTTHINDETLSYSQEQANNHGNEISDQLGEKVTRIQEKEDRDTHEINLAARLRRRMREDTHQDDGDA